MKVMVVLLVERIFEFLIHADDLPQFHDLLGEGKCLLDTLRP